MALVLLVNYALMRIVLVANDARMKVRHRGCLQKCLNIYSEIIYRISHIND